MLETNELAEPHLTLTSRIVSASTRMNDMVGALLDFTRSRLGGGIPIVPAPMNMGKVVHDVVEEICAAHPKRTIKVEARGALKGSWDCARMSQVVSNLVGNALEHGDHRGVVTVDVRGDPEEVILTVHNRGRAIPDDEMDGIFGAMKQQDKTLRARRAPSTNLGLGLYIVDQIVQAHKGKITVESSDQAGTTFTVRLPRSVRT
jgi:signal transduction histidine kinase